MKKRFALDDDRLKRLGGGNYFDELLARIRDIRSSEKSILEKVAFFVLYSECIFLLSECRTSNKNQLDDTLSPVEKDFIESIGVLEHIMDKSK